MLSIHASLNSRYGLDSSQAGYIFLAVSCPMLVFVPLAGLLTDRIGARYASISCLTGFIVCLSLLCINKLPYEVFVVLLVAAGIGTR